MTDDDILFSFGDEWKLNDETRARAVWALASCNRFWMSLKIMEGFSILRRFSISLFWLWILVCQTALIWSCNFSAYDMSHGTGIRCTTVLEDWRCIAVFILTIRKRGPANLANRIHLRITCSLWMKRCGSLWILYGRMLVQKKDSIVSWNAKDNFDSETDALLIHWVITAESWSLLLPQWRWKSTVSVGRIKSQNAMVAMAGNHDRKIFDIVVTVPFLWFWSATDPRKNIDSRTELLWAARSSDFSSSSRARLSSAAFRTSTAWTSASTKHKKQKKGPIHTKANCEIVRVDSHTW